MSPTEPSELTTASLDSLQNEMHRKVMDIVDQMRRIGLDSILQLPQLVVCGDQSAGKSSVLEAITQIPFPRKENLCTRFATEIVLRRSDHTTIVTKITPDRARSQDDAQQLRRFSKTIKDFGELPSLIDEATAAMGLSKSPDTGNAAFAKDVLSIEISGPSRPQLTLVDLPGLIHSTNKFQSKIDVALIKSLVEDYISNPRTIILPVISAKNDFANQIILNHCRQVDTAGHRTLGIITKPDLLRPGSENEKTWLELAQNRNIQFELGWHMVRNRDDGDSKSTFEERNQAEKVFFSGGAYQDLDRHTVGIDSLRSRLSRLLQKHLQKELPGLQKELNSNLVETDKSLSLLSDKRATLPEQRQYLIQHSMQAHDIIKAAVQGHYENQFFGPIDNSASLNMEKNLPRLRANIQHMNIRFAHTMRNWGHKHTISRDAQDVLEAEDKADGINEVEYGYGLQRQNDIEKEDSQHSKDVQRQSPVNAVAPVKLSQQAAVDWVLQILRKSRGCELPGNFNPMLISHLFWEQSEPWEKLASAHIEQVFGICRQFVDHVLEHTVPPEVQSALMELKIQPALEEAFSQSRIELSKIIEDKRSHPMTYNHYYTTTIQKMRENEFKKSIRSLGSKASVGVPNKWDGGTTTYVDREKLQGLTSSHIEQDMDRFSAREALNSQMAYYKDELKYFIGVITKQVVERHLISPLPTKILSPIIVAGFTDEEIRYIAAESEEVTRKRTALMERKKMLEEGKQAFKKLLGGFR